MPTAALRPRSATEIVDASFQIYRAHFGPLVLCSAIAYLPAILMQLVLQAAPADSGLLGSGGKIGFFLIAGLVSLISYSLMAAVLTFCGSQAYLGEPVDVGDAVRRAIPKIGAVIGVSILVYIAVVIGFVLLIVPGIILVAAYFAATPALVLENLGPVDAMRRSQALSKGRKGHILKTLALMFAIYFLLAMGLGIVAALLRSLTLQTVLSSILTVCLYPLISLMITLLYYDARVQSEGLDIELMAGALDPMPAPSAG